MRLCLYLALLSSFSVFAQEGVEVVAPSKKDSIRDLYIRRFPDHFFVYPVLKQRSLSFELEKVDRSDLLTFRPNTTYSLGVGAYLFEVGVELTFAVPLDEKKEKIYGTSHARDLQGNILGKNFGVDIYYQRYRGFYLTEKLNIPKAGDPFPQRSDIVSRNLGFTGSYVFSKRFSFRSVYNFSERQLFSKGTFLVSTNIGRFKLAADSSILDTSQEVVFGSKVSFKDLRYSTFSLAPGYAYTIVYKNFFLNGSLSIGPAHHWIYYQYETGAGKNQIAINSFVAARIAIGYNGDRIFGGIAFLTQGSTVKFEDVEFTNNNGSFKVLMGYRFREFGLLKKRAWDAIPFKI